MAIHNREFDDERCKNCSVNAKCLACDVYLKPTIAELEKIKAELNQVLPTYAYLNEGATTFKSGTDKIIDNHIKELKGEKQ